MNSFGTLYRLTSFGESHGPAVGGIIDGMPSNVIISRTEIDDYMARRRPGGKGVSQRHENDRVQFLSGMMECDSHGNITGAMTADSKLLVTLGTPIGFVVHNTDSRPDDYGNLKDSYRPSHADYAWEKKYGLRDWRGGGRSSGRETVSRVVAGAFAAQVLKKFGVTASASIVSVGTETDPKLFAAKIHEAVAAHDSIGGVVECRITGVPAGWGEPVFGKLQQMLASAVMSIGGVKGFEYGAGFSISAMKGSDANDPFYIDGNGYIRYVTNNSGGIQGGISTGEEIILRACFKPTPTIGIPQRTVNKLGEDTIIDVRGRHDPCIAVRGAAVVEAMVLITLCDAMLMSRSAVI